MFFPNIPPEVDHDAIKLPPLCFSNFIRHLRQNFYNDFEEPIVFINNNPNHYFMSSQTSFVNGQSLHRCVGVSCSMPHNLQIGSCCQLRLLRLLAVRIFLWSSVHARIRHLGGLAFAFQICIILILMKVPQTVYSKHSLLCILHLSSTAIVLCPP